MSGWIKIHRTITHNWVWQNSDYLKWWLDILIEVNHTPSKTLIKGTLYECLRGQKLYSLETWAKRWDTNKSKSRRFLKMLEKDNMIVFKSETQTTRITVCNYDSYQSFENDNETQMKRKRNASETQVKTIQECKEEIKKRKEEFKNSLRPFISIYYDKILMTEFFEYWSEHGDNDKKMRFEKEKSFSIERRLKTWKIKSVEFKNKGKL